MERSHVPGDTSTAAALSRNLTRPRGEANFDFLAINVPSTYQQGVIPDGEVAPWGLLRVVMAAREWFGREAGILDAHALKLQPADIRAQIIRTGAHLVGLNPTSVNVPEAIAIARICDELRVPYVLGGVFATLDPTAARQDFRSAYAIVRGDGERAIGHVIASLAGDNTGNIPGVYYRNRQYRATSAYAARTRPEEVPVIRQDLFVESPLYRYTARIGGTNRDLREASLYVTTGCPFECTFCATPIMVNRGNGVPYFRPPMDRIVDEIEHVLTDLGADAIHFLDDMAFVSGENIRQLHRQLTHRGLIGRFAWRGLTRATIILRNDFDELTMSIMKETGLWKLALGIESGNDDVLRRIKKRISTSEIEAAVTKLAAHDIVVKGFFIMGFPDESEEEIAQTARFVMALREIGLSEASIYQFKPYPGTAEFEQLKRIRPEVLRQLRYLKRDEIGIMDQSRGESETDVWLPDDLRIARITSGEVREHITTTLRTFYADKYDRAVTRPLEEIGCA